MYTAARGECNYVNSLRGTCYYYYIIIILIIIIPNILISVGMQCPRAEEREREQKRQRWIDGRRDELWSRDQKMPEERRGSLKVKHLVDDRHESALSGQYV